MIEIEIRRDKEFNKLLTRLLLHYKNMRPAMVKIAGVMHDAVEENFEKEGRPKRWIRLKPSTIKQRTREGKWPGKILQKSAGGLAASTSRRATADSAVVGAKKKYAAIHQRGGRAGKGHKAKIPARPFLKLTAEDMGVIKKTLMDYLMSGYR